MGLHKHYLRYGQSAREKIFGFARESRSSKGGGGGGGGGTGGPRMTMGSGAGGTPLSMLISQGTKFNSSKYNQNNYFHIYFVIILTILLRHIIHT